ncbi:hypothetical protein [Ekhidna sp.]|uniref:hypothetical protein n=1 Tax=Ekhidna sp. TaxID=2608089 RepID=UPI003B50B5C9
MTPFIIGNIQFTLSLIVYSMIAVWYVQPKLKQMEWNKAIVPLLLVHAFRYGPLTLLMPGQVSNEAPLDVVQTIAYGDLASGILAIITALLVWNKAAGAKLAIWLFTIVGFGDVALASAKGIGAGLLDIPMGFNLYILNFYVPMLIVTHFMIILLLTKRST